MTKPIPKPTILHDDQGQPAFAVLPWADWRRLADLAATLLETPEEDAFAARISAEVAASDDGFRLPLEQLRAIRGGEHVVAVLRKWRDLDQAELAERMGTKANYISQIESRARRGVRLAADFAKALDVPEALIKAHL